MLIYTYRANHDGAYIQCTNCGSQFNEDRYGQTPQNWLNSHNSNKCGKKK